MWRDAGTTLANFALRFLLVVSLGAGGALTVAAAGFGWYWLSRVVAGDLYYPYGGHRRLPTAKMQVKMVRDAATQFMIETPRCPRGIDELVAGKYLDRINVTDPWGSPLTFRCPGHNDSDGADVTSWGPDKELGTADDINSWDM
jgi:hypothetical protein